MKRRYLVVGLTAFTGGFLLCLGYLWWLSEHEQANLVWPHG